MELKVEKLDGIVDIVPQGEIDLHNSPQLRQNLQQIIKDGKTNVIINLKNVSYMDSSGLATLVEAFQKLMKKGKKLVLYSLSDAVKNILSITRLDEIFAIYSSREEAIKNIGK